MEFWTALHIDRDFTTGTYGNGPTLLTNLIGGKDGIYDLISYKNTDDGIKVKTKCNNEVILKGESNKKKFEEYYQVWKKWDLKNGEGYDEDRCDFEPIHYKTLEDLKKGLKKI